MRLGFALLAAAVAGSCAAPAPPPAAAHKDVAELAGRTAGRPQRCVPAQGTLAFRVADADPHLLLYGEGKTVWVNELGPGCGFPDGGAIRPDTSASYYCSGDFVRAPGPLNVLPGSHCALGTFVPYRN